VELRASGGKELRHRGDSRVQGVIVARLFIAQQQRDDAESCFPGVPRRVVQARSRSEFCPRLFDERTHETRIDARARVARHGNIFDSPCERIELGPFSFDRVRPDGWQGRIVRDLSREGSRHGVRRPHERERIVDEPLESVHAGARAISASVTHRRSRCDRTSALTIC